MLDDVINGTTRAVWRLPDGSFHALDSAAAPSGPLAVLSGSFNPMHEGHIELASVAEQSTGRPVVFELSVTNVDKPATPRSEVLSRIESVSRPIVITQAPTFVEKCDLFAGACFVVGMDTAVRIIDPQYYAGSEQALRQALARIRSADCHFVVAGRLMTGQFRSLQSAAITAEFASMFTGIPEAAFRKDISSTELRNRS